MTPRDLGRSFRRSWPPLALLLLMLAGWGTTASGQEQGTDAPSRIDQGDPLRNDTQTIIIAPDAENSRVPDGAVRPAEAGLEYGPGTRTDNAPGPAQSNPDARTILYVGDGPGRAVPVEEGGAGGVTISGEPPSDAERIRLMAKDAQKRGDTVGGRKVEGGAPEGAVDTMIHVDNVIVTTGRGGENRNKACVRIGAVGSAQGDCGAD
ncbi:hypothetical protein KAJ83_09005 [Marivibrio halodurans]|uniref:Uncharacterized protein n=1 Tax=Marivibrio halodurans TaxID=2039722 RepID=A0A8J7RYM8_9PROT|nr:hypothetical protein [Marivibrio halodurans]MBP5857147.1 hypothetical protein [Marivibrio halodurans]